MLVGNKRFFFFDEEQGGGAPTTPPVAAPVEVAEHVEAASTGATEIAASTGEGGWNIVANKLDTLNENITKLAKHSVKAAAPATTPAAKAAPDVEVEVPKPPERKVRRGGRKVTRRG